MDRTIVVLERDSIGQDVDISCLEDFGRVEYYGNTAPEEVASRIQNADIVVSNKSPLHRASLEGARKLGLVCQLATGYDNCRLEDFARLGIRLANVVNYSTDMVAQHTFALALALQGGLFYYDRYVKSGEYAHSSRFSHFAHSFSELSGKTWGIVGFGHIGQKVASIATAFGARVIVHSLTGRAEAGPYALVDKTGLLEQSDILSLHCPLSPLSRHFIDSRALAQMKPTAILVNVARGAVVCSQSLYEALEAGAIRAAGLDVLEQEPISPDNPLGRIQDSCRLLITPHVAWASVEARRRCVEGVYRNIEAYLEGRPFAEVALPAIP